MKLTIALMIVLLTGCTAARDLAKSYQSAEKFAVAVDQYCINIPYAERMTNRAAVNDLTTLGDITVDCQGDPQ
jgi:hypothetical protein